MKTTVIVCPFAQFGSSGAAQGAELLADALREVLDDARLEKRPTRTRALRNSVRLVELSFVDTKSLVDWQGACQRALTEQAPGEFFIWLGGNHLSVLPVYEHLAVAGTSVVQFDAHLDLYNLDDCKRELNHGNFLRHAERLPPIVNVGHRDLFLPSKSIAEYFAAAHSAASIAIDAEPIETALRKWTAAADSVFVDLDCDVLDPAFFPATTHPMPFGLSPTTLLRLLDAAWSPRMRGVAISEFDPGRDRDERSLQTLVWLLEWLLLRLHE